MSEQTMYSILIVDDNPNNLFTLRTLLEASLDTEVIEAESGYAALEKVSEQKVDLILLDIQMPELNGFEVAKLIRSRPKYQDIPIIFLTAFYKSEEFKQQGFQSGAIDYLTKPIDDTILINRVKAYLRVIEGERAINRKLEDMNKQLQREIEERTRMEKALEVMNQQLEEASQHKTDFLSSMSHELRTPLNALIGYMSLSLNALKNTLPHEDLQNLIRADRSARALLQLINDVLDFSKIEAGKIELLIEKIDLAEIVEDVAITAEGLLLDKPVELKSDIDPDLPFINSDYTKIKQMLNNLIGNAIKFTSEGYVAVRALFLESENVVRIEVEDTGAGIPQEKIGSVFESFKQVDSSIKKKFGGTGLGLAITKSFCDMLGIEIGIESEVDKGTTFWLNIPVDGVFEREEDGVTSREAEKFGSETISGQPEEIAAFHSVLVIDDDEMNLQLMESIFELAGYTLYKALSGQEGIKIARDVLPDVIIMDLAMPDMDGLEATQLLKHDSLTAGIPVIACSAFVTRESKEKAFQAGCEDFISRPIEPDRLIEQVTSIVSKSRIRKKE